MGVTRHRTQVYLEDRQYQYLRRRALEEGASIAEVVRRLIDEKLAPQLPYEENPIFKLGAHGTTTGVTDGSVTHDEYLYRRPDGVR